MPRLFHRAGNWAYANVYPLYRPAYAAFKQYGDRHERALLRRIVVPGDLVVDAGANIGIYSEFLAQLVGRNGAVHSFEPSPDNFARLQAATAHVPQIHANQLALGAESRESLLFVSDELNVDHRTYSPAGESRRAVTIKTVALDDYIQPAQKVHLLKMDIQGFEFHALLGAKRLLADNPEMKLLFEFWPHGLQGAGSEPLAVPRFLQERGYQLSTIADDALVPFDNSLAANLDVGFYCNVFAERRAS